MEWLRGFFYTALIVGLFATLHFTEPQWYAPVRKHPVYEDLITPYMTLTQQELQPYVEWVIRHPLIAGYLGLEPLRDEESDASMEKNGIPVMAEDSSASGPASAEGQLKTFTEPSQMGFSLTRFHEKLSKRSVISTEGKDSAFFEIPDGSRLWLEKDSIAELAWVDKDAAKEGAKAEILLRIERGVMHVQRPSQAKAKFFLITNSGVKHSLAPGDMWMASAQMGVIDPGEFPDAEKYVKGRYTDYVRRATLDETRALSARLKADSRREVMLYQDQLRLAADREDNFRKNLEKRDILPSTVAVVPLEIPSRRGGKDLASHPASGGRAPASLMAPQDPSQFPRRAPASVASGLDEGTRGSAEAKIFKWTDANKCSRAKSYFKDFLKEHSLSDSDPWAMKMSQHLAQRCP